jgi:hypothetical protein
MTFCFLSIFILGNIHSIRAQDISDLNNRTPFRLSGELGLSTIFYSTEGRDAYRSPFTYIFTGSPTVSIYGMDFPVQIRISEQERDFRQPMNRIGLSPYYKWAKLHLGYQSLQYSKYTLNGHALTGIGFEVTPGNWNINYMRGTLLSAISPNDFVEDLEFKVQPTYKRTGQFLKLGYGTEKSALALVFVDAADISNSLPDSINGFSITPAENNIISLVGNHEITKGLVIDAEYAQSAYTDNANSEALESTPQSAGIVGLIADRKNSTDIRSALEANIRYRGKVFSGKINYQRIDPNYNSMGAYFFLNDVEKISFDPSVKVGNGKINIAGSLGFQKNNLDQQKDRQTTRSIGSLRTQIRPFSNYNISLTYSNFGIAQSVMSTSMNPQEEVSQVTKNIGINQSFQWINNSQMHNALINIQKQSLNDQNPNTAIFSDYDNLTIFGTYSFNYMPSRTGFTATYTFSEFENNTFSTVYEGPNFSIQQSLLKNKIRVSLTQSFLSNSRDSELIRKIRKTTLRLSLNLMQSHKISIRSHYNKSESFDEKITPFSEFKTELNYAYRFQ